MPENACSLPAPNFSTGPADPPDSAGPVAAEVVQYANGSGSMGLTGVFKTVGNLTSMVIISGLFVWAIVKQDSRATEDRAMYRDQIEKWHTQHGTKIDRLTDSLQSQIRSVDSLTAELRRNGVGAKPPGNE